MELNVPIPIFDHEGYAHPHFDESAADRQLIKHHKLESSEVPMSTHFAVGAMRGGALHLAPVRRIQQLRPSFAHVDAYDEKEQAEQETLDDDLEVRAGRGREVGRAGRGRVNAGRALSDQRRSAPSVAQGAPAKAKTGEKKEGPAEVKSSGYQRRESERAKTARLSSWSHQHSTEISEPFLNLNVQVRMRMFV
jgi:hypothetical protein